VTDVHRDKLPNSPKS